MRENEMRIFHLLIFIVASNQGRRMMSDASNQTSPLCSYGVSHQPSRRSSRMLKIKGQEKKPKTMLALEFLVNYSLNTHLRVVLLVAYHDYFGVDRFMDLR